MPGDATISMVAAEADYLRKKAADAETAERAAHRWKLWAPIVGTILVGGNWLYGYIKDKGREEKAAEDRMVETDTAIGKNTDAIGALQTNVQAVETATEANTTAINAAQEKSEKSFKAISVKLEAMSPKGGEVALPK